MSKANEPIQYRLGDLKPTDIILSDPSDPSVPSVIVGVRLSGNMTVAMPEATENRWLDENLRVTRLIPETPATKHAEAMLNLLQDHQNWGCDYRDIMSLLSTIDAENNT